MSDINIEPKLVNNNMGIGMANQNPITEDPDQILMEGLGETSSSQGSTTRPIERPLWDPLEKLTQLLLKDPYRNLDKIDELAELLAKRTGIEKSLYREDRLISFFLREKEDLTGDGRINSKDVIEFWKHPDGNVVPPPIVRPPITAPPTLLNPSNNNGATPIRPMTGPPTLINRDNE